MSHEVIMPQLGMSQDSAVIVGWRKTLGEAVAKGDVLFEVETDKAVMEVEARVGGFIGAILAEAQQEVPVGQCIAYIVDRVEDVDNTRSPETASNASSSAPSSPPEAKPSATAADHTSPPTQAVTGGVSKRVLASPKAKRLAQQRGFDLKQLREQGASEPLHAADIPLKPNPLTAAKPSGRISAKCRSDAVDTFLQWAEQQEATGIRSAQLWACFCATAMPQQPQSRPVLVDVSEHFEPSSLWAVHGHQLQDTHAVDQGQAPLRVVVLRGTHIEHYLPEDNQSSATLVISGEPQHTHLSLHFSTEHWPPNVAAQWLEQIARRCQNPLYQLY